MRSRYADDVVCAVRVRREADWLYQALPTRLETCTREVAPEKPRLLRCSRVHPGRTRRCTCVGCECFWQEDRQGGPRVKRRPARQTWQRAGTRSKAWMQAKRHRPGNAFVHGLKARLRGHDRSSGVHGNSRALSRVFDGAMQGACKWRNRRGGKRRSFSWARFTQILEAVPLERPRMTEGRRRSVFA